MTTPHITTPAPSIRTGICRAGNNTYLQHDLNGRGACKRCGQVFSLPKLK